DPIAAEAIRMATWRLRHLILKPAYNAVRIVTKSMNAANARPGTVTRLEMIFNPVKPGGNLTFQDEIGLFQGMVMWAGPASRFILNHEQGGKLGTEVTIHHHLDCDAAVDQ